MTAPVSSFRASRSVTIGLFLAALLALPGPAVAASQLLAHHPLAARAAAAQTLPEPGVSRQLNAVTCVAANDCWAVGAYESPAGVSKSEILHWTGSAWRAVKAPSPAGGSFLDGIACRGQNTCVSVGGTGNYMDRPQVNFALSWNGRAWKTEDMPTQSCRTAACTTAFLRAVACGSAGRCLGVGQATDTNVIYNTAVSRAVSGWRTASPPSASYGGDATQGINGLNGVSCASASACWAVGNTGFGGDRSGGSDEALFWNGRRWRQARTPSTGNAKRYGSGPSLQAVTCADSNDCWAAGFSYGRDGQTKDQILSDKGTGWKLAFTGPGPTGRPAAGNWALNGVACISSRECWAAGAGPHGNQLLKADSAAWSLISAPNPSGGARSNGKLTGISCLPSGECWAVGYFKKNGADFNQILELRGGRWSLITPGSSSKKASPEKPVVVATGGRYGFDNPYNAAADSAHLWVTNSDSGTVFELSASSGALVSRRTVAGANHPIATDGAHVWVVSGRTSNEVSELDAGNGRLVRVVSGSRYHLNFPDAICSDGKHVWVANGAAPFTITEFSAASGNFVRLISPPMASGSIPVAIASDGRYLWLAYAGTGGIVELSAATGKLIREIKGVAKGIYMPVALYAAGGRVSVVNDSSVTRVDGANSKVLGIEGYDNHEFTHPAAVMPGARFLWETSANGADMIKLPLSR